MAHLPQQRINDGQARTAKLVLVEIAEQLQRALTRVDGGFGESGPGNRQETQAVTFVTAKSCIPRRRPLEPRLQPQTVRLGTGRNDCNECLAKSADDCRLLVVQAC